MTHVLLGSVFAALLLQPLPASQSPAIKGSPVTFSGCVKQGTHPDSFLMMDVKRTDGGIKDPNIVYWLAPDKLIGHNGQLVQISGTVSGVDSGKIKVEVDPRKEMDTKIAIERGMSKAEAELATMPVGTTGKAVKIEEPRTVLKVKVISLQVLSDSC